MAQAFKCDRCGKYYSAEDDNRVDNILRIVLKRNGYILDMCSNCATSLLNWLNRGEDNENDDTTDV